MRNSVPPLMLFPTLCGSCGWFYSQPLLPGYSASRPKKRMSKPNKTRKHGDKVIIDETFGRSGEEAPGL
jgi:hypothetical protein